MPRSLEICFVNSVTPRNVFIQETRNYAGHSKWQNIKATKQQQDSAKSALFKSLAGKMKVAVTEAGTADIDSNVKLAQLIDQAKKANMPASTLNGILTKLSNPQDGEVYILPVRCSSGAVVILHVLSSNIMPVKLEVNHIIKKFNGRVVDNSVLTMFECASYIAASKECTLDEAMEDAIKADADDVEQVNHDDGKKHFQFKSEFLFPDKVLNKLSNLGYSVISIDHVCTPTTLIDLNETELNAITKMKEKLLKEIRSITKIEDNIAV